MLFASTHDDETFVYDLGEANDPDMVMKMLSEPDIINMRKEAGVDLESQEVLSTISKHKICLLYTSPSPRDRQKSRMPSSA